MGVYQDIQKMMNTEDGEKMYELITQKLTQTQRKIDRLTMVNAKQQRMLRGLLDKKKNLRELRKQYLKAHEKHFKQLREKQRKVLNTSKQKDTL